MSTQTLRETGISDKARTLVRSAAIKALARTGGTLPVAGPDTALELERITTEVYACYRAMLGEVADLLAEYDALLRLPQGEASPQAHARQAMDYHGAKLPQRLLQAAEENLHAMVEAMRLRERALRLAAET